MKNGFIILIALVLLLSPTRVRAYDRVSESAQLMYLAVDARNPEDNRAERLRDFLRSYEPRIKSPLTAEADHIVAVADENGLDWKLVVAIAGVESTFCQKIPAGSFNCWGWGIPTGARSGIGFDSYSDGISTVTNGLAQNYISKGAVTVEQIGRKYAASPTWAQKVRYFLGKIEDYERSATLPDMEITI